MVFLVKGESISAGIVKEELDGVAIEDGNDDDEKGGLGCDAAELDKLCGA